jgi:hypothetical protein
LVLGALCAPHAGTISTKFFAIGQIDTGKSTLDAENTQAQARQMNLDELHFCVTSGVPRKQSISLWFWNR